MKKVESYLVRKLEGHLNAHKAETLEALKAPDKFVECCEERGFVYKLSIVAFDEEIQLQIGLKNGYLKIHDVKRSRLLQAV